jgi:hypothetical protein
VEKVLDKRTSMGIVGDLNKYTQFSAAEAMTKAAENPGAAGTMIGLGLGGMAMQGGPWGAAPQAAAPATPVPPPPPTEVQWHLAKDGQTSGPYGQAALAKMIASGQVTADSHVWTAGQDGWKRAGEVGALAALFAQVPPPPPPGF